MTIKSRSWRYFLASVATAGISLLTLPLTTLELGPRDYGLLALGTAIAGFGVALAGLGATFVIANRWAVADDAERTRIASTLTATSLGIALLWAIAAMSLFYALRDYVAFLAELPATGVFLLMVGLVLAPFWIVAGEILTVEGRAGLFALVTVGQAVVSAAATLAALFAFELGTLSLFVGLFAGALVSFAVGLVVLTRSLAVRFDRSQWRELAQAHFLVAQLTETSQSFVERVLLSRFSGYAELGLYTHSQRYRVVAHQAAKAVSRGVWPVTLDEARDPSGAFPATRRTWNAAHVGIAAAGVAVTALGDVVISLLTNDKFTDAWVYLGPWFVYLLLQFTARPEIGALYALTAGRLAALLSTISNLTGIVAAVVLIPIFGAPGAVAAAILQVLVYRVLVRVPTRRRREIPFQDAWALLGIVVIAAVWALKLVLEPGLGGDVALLLAGEGALFALAAPVIGETARTFPRARFTRA